MRQISVHQREVKPYDPFAATAFWRFVSPSMPAFGTLRAASRLEGVSHGTKLPADVQELLNQLPNAAQHARKSLYRLYNYYNIPLTLAGASPLTLAGASMRNVQQETFRYMKRSIRWPHNLLRTRNAGVSLRAGICARPPTTTFKRTVP